MDTARPHAATLAELLVSAAELLATAPAGAAATLRPVGTPVRRGRLALGRYRGLVAADARAARVQVAACFAGACWLGPVSVPSPDLGRLAYRSETPLDGRGRLVLDRRARGWLAVPDPDRFDVLLVPGMPGLWVVPLDDLDRRWEEVSRHGASAG
jgi:hypothetical protein